MSDESFDLIVVGGGPAGSTLATLVAKAGSRVLLLERERFPRYQIGESLLPATFNSICELLGVREQMEQAGFVLKRGATFAWGLEPESLWTMNFGRSEGEDESSPHAYNVPRDVFDKVLLDNARRLGVDVREGHKVTDYVVERGRVWGVRYEDERGVQGKALATFVAGATGQQSKLAALIGERQHSNFFRNVSLFGYYEGSERLPGALAGNVLLHACQGGWMWHIPVSESLTSVGAVVHSEAWERLKGDKELALNEFIASCPRIAGYLEHATRVTEGPYSELRVRKEFSYANSRFWIPGALVIGDAACFIDVILSSGVHLATYGALLAARSINTILAGGVDKRRCLDEFELRYRLEFTKFYQGLVGLHDMNQVGTTYQAWLRGMLQRTQGVLMETGDARPAPGTPSDGVEFLRAMNRDVLSWGGPAKLEGMVAAPLVRGSLVPTPDRLRWQDPTRGADPTLETFAGLGASQVRPPLFDYGKLYQGVAEYPVLYPSNGEEARAAVRLAQRSGTPIRVRASGHTFSGASLPRAGEILIRTDRLDQFRFEEPGRLVAGAGALVWDVRDLAQDHGFDLPVYNGGWAGPTLGGYINAGGFGKSGLSEERGGLWENVRSVSFVDGKGTLQTVRRGEPAFPWLFGSYGQFGLLIEAELDLIPLERGEIPNESGGEAPYPLGLEGPIPRRQEEDPKDNDRPPLEGRQRSLFWFTLLISPAQEARAWEELAALVARFPDSLVPDGGWAGPLWRDEQIGYRYVIKFEEFNPPLVYPRDETFLVVGVMSWLEAGDAGSNQALLELEQAFVELALENDFRLYLQAENIGCRVDLRDYYGPEVFDAFVGWKRRFDPEDLFNRGILPR